VHISAKNNSRWGGDRQREGGEFGASHCNSYITQNGFSSAFRAAMMSLSYTIWTE